jgi:FKBP-type peptidyl-prolyl cis-trans isomerase
MRTRAVHPRGNPRRFALASFALAFPAFPAFIVLAGCGGDGDDVSPKDPGASTTPAGDSSAAAGAAAIDMGDGLLLEVLRPGDGPVASTGCRVGVTYRARVKDAETPFDATPAGGAPLEFTLGVSKLRVIEGLSRGLDGLREGARAKLTIPSALAWGASGNPSAGVPENADVVYEVHLVSVD